MFENICIQTTPGVFTYVEVPGRLINLEAILFIQLKHYIFT